MYKLCMVLIILTLFGCSPEDKFVEKKVKPPVQKEKVYSELDWKIFNSCKSRVYDGEVNNMSHYACSNLLKEKADLKAFGATQRYIHWMEARRKSIEVMKNCTDWGDGYWCSPVHSELKKKFPDVYIDIESECKYYGNKHSNGSMRVVDIIGEFSHSEELFLNCIKGYID